jgi:hypothetical protein
MSALNLIRLAKVIALLAFILPWAAVSCQGADVATATGIEMMQGKMSPNPDFEREIGERFGGGGLLDGGEVESDPPMELGLNIFAIGAGIVVLAGLGLSFLGAPRTATRNTLVTSLLAIALAGAAFWWFREGVFNSVREDGGGPSNNGQAGGSFGVAESQFLDSMVQHRYGFWINIGALVVAAGAAGVVLARRETPPAA